MFWASALTGFPTTGESRGCWTIFEASWDCPSYQNSQTILTRLFKQGRRRKGETMNEYITRKTETYMRAQQSLGRVLRAYGHGTTSLPSSTTRMVGSMGRSNAWDSSSAHASGGQESEDAFHEAQEQHDGRDEDDAETMLRLERTHGEPMISGGGVKTKDGGPMIGTRHGGRLHEWSRPPRSPRSCRT